jgi:hypothetical protein
MRAIVIIVGVILIVAAAVYFLVPADALPTFFPGHETGLMLFAPNTACCPELWGSCCSP